MSAYSRRLAADQRASHRLKAICVRADRAIEISKTLREQCQALREDANTGRQRRNELVGVFLDSWIG